MEESIAALILIWHEELWASAAAIVLLRSSSARGARVPKYRTDLRRSLYGPVGNDYYPIAVERTYCICISITFYSVLDRGSTAD